MNHYTNVLNHLSSIENHISSAYDIAENRFANIPEEKNIQNLKPTIKNILAEDIRYFENKEDMLSAESISASDYFIQENSEFDSVYLPDCITLKNAFNIDWTQLWSCSFGAATADLKIYGCDLDFMAAAKENGTDITIFKAIFDTFVAGEYDYSYLVFAVHYIDDNNAEIKFWGSDDQVEFTYIPLQYIYNAAAASSYTFEDMGLRSRLTLNTEYKYINGEKYNNQLVASQGEFIPSFGEFLMLENQPNLRFVYNNGVLDGLYKGESVEFLNKNSKFNKVIVPGESFSVKVPSLSGIGYEYIDINNSYIFGLHYVNHETNQCITIYAIKLIDGNQYTKRKIYISTDGENFTRITAQEANDNYGYSYVINEYSQDVENTEFTFPIVLSWNSLSMDGYTQSDSIGNLVQAILETNYAETSLAATPSYVWGKTFYGVNGVETGTLNNLTPASRDQLNIQLQLRDSLSVLSTEEKDLSHLFDGYNGKTLPTITHTAENIAYMYANCPNLQYINISYYDLTEGFDNAKDMENMFLNCPAIYNNYTLSDLLYQLPNYYNLTNPSSNNLEYLGINSQIVFNLNLNKSDYVYAYNNGWNVPITFYNYNITYNTTDNSELTSVSLREPEDGIDYFNNGYVVTKYIGSIRNIVTLSIDGTNHIENYNQMFMDYYPLLRSIVLNNTTNAKDMGDMFYNCRSLISISNFNTSNVTNMAWMFSQCYSLTTAPNFDTSNVTNMYCMFYYCDNLTTVPNFDTSNVTSMEGMFSKCKLSDASYANIANSLPSAVNLTNQYVSSIGLNVNRFTMEQLKILNSKGYLDAEYLGSYTVNYSTVDNPTVYTTVEVERR